MDEYRTVGRYVFFYNNNNKINVTGIRAAAFDRARASP